MLLFETLLATGFATGKYGASPKDGLRLVDCMITNAVRCAPPANRPTTGEEAACRPFLAATLASLPRLKVIVALGDVARRNVLRALGERPTNLRGHGLEIPAGRYTLLGSYHCSRLNTNTGRLTAAMFREIFDRARVLADGQ